MDKLNLTGSRAQWINGLALMFAFFASRLVWGSYYCFWLFSDVWVALREVSSSGDEGQLPIPPWLALLYVTSMLALSVLNMYWFGRMVSTVMSRFEGKGSGKEQIKNSEEVKKDANGGKGKKNGEKDTQKMLQEEKDENERGSKKKLYTRERNRSKE